MLTLIAAISKNNCIGKDGKLPWSLPEDMKHFKDITSGKTVLMGRKTWESLPERFRPLPNRHNIVITRQVGYVVPEGVDRYTSVTDALADHAADDLVVIGGAEIYVQTIGQADVLEITSVDQIVEGDAFFPTIEPTQWQEVSRQDHPGFSFIRYVKHTT